MTEPVTFSLRLPDEMATKIMSLADADKRSKANVIRVLLSEALAARGMQ